MEARVSGSLARGVHLSQRAQAKWSKEERLYRSENYRARVLTKLATELGLPKLNFQVLRRTMATLAQTEGGVKDVQGVLGHSKADTTVNVYMQQIEASVKQTLDAIYLELTAPKVGAGV
jgi:integrase